MAALALIDSANQTITVSARLFFYGSQATQALGQSIADEIMTHYNQPAAQIPVGDAAFALQFAIEYVVIEDLQDLIFLSRNNRDYRNNFIRIETKNRVERSFMGNGLGQNVGHWLVTDQLGTSTTAPHEFGHGLGLDHPEDLDFRGKGLPPMMAPRGSLVDAQYQWNPEAVAGEYGGTMNPVHRRVTEAELQDIFKHIDLSNRQSVELGRISNLVYDEMGHPLRLV